MSERWVEWVPLPDMERYDAFESATDGKEVVIRLARVGVFDDNLSIHARTIAYSVTDEWLILNSVRPRDTIDPNGGHSSWNLFRIDGSEYIARLTSESNGLLNEVRRNNPYLHYRILTSEVVIDLICTDEPHVMRTL